MKLYLVNPIEMAWYILCDAREKGANAMLVTVH